MYRCIKDKEISTQKILVTNDNKIIGINLGCDYIKEHELGICNIRNFFDINDYELGIAAYTINKRIYSNKLIYKKIKIKNINYVCLTLETNKILGTESINEKYLIDNGLYPYENILDIENEELYPGLYTAWSNSSFGILAEEKYESYIEDIYKAFYNGDISFDVHSDNFFPNNGLTICINSRIPQNIIYEIYKKDKSYFKLLCKVENIGVKKILERKKKEYSKLIPKWKDDLEKEIVFYLIPKETNKYESGWYTFSELMDWTQNIGPIIKTESCV